MNDEAERKKNRKEGDRNYGKWKRRKSEKNFECLILNLFPSKDLSNLKNRHSSIHGFFFFFCGLCALCGEFSFQVKTRHWNIEFHLIGRLCKRGAFVIEQEFIRSDDNKI